MKPIVWLASYPKSGNTWVRLFLSAYFGEAETLDLDDVTVSMHSASRVAFDRVIGIPSSDLTPDEITDLRPAVYRALAEEFINDVKFMKVHDGYHHTPSGEPLFPPEISRVAIVIVRNPLSVAPSYAAHLEIGLDEAIRRMEDDHSMIARSSGSLAPQLPQRLGSWSGHVASWLGQSDVPTHLVRYEDLVDDPVTSFSHLLSACGTIPDLHQVRVAVDLCRFDRLRAVEAERGFKERVGSEPFFRKGRTDSWKLELRDDQSRRIVRAHGEWMGRLGYSTSTD